MALQPQQVRYRFVNEDPTWRYRDLIFDEAPQIVEQRRRAHDNWAWADLNVRQPKHLEKLYGILWTLMKLPPSQRRSPLSSSITAPSFLIETLMKWR